MKNLFDYEKTQSATVDLPFGAFKDESSPGQQDGTDIVAAHIQDIAYPLYQILQLAGIVPNGELEDGNTKTQFIEALTNIGIFKYSDKVSYNFSSFVWTITGSDFILYRSNKAENSDELTNTTSWIKILSINNKNKINFYVQTNISGGSGSGMPVFCFNSGPVDASGESALVTLSGTTLTQHSPAVCTTAGGDTYSIDSDLSIDLSGLAAGSYYGFYNVDTNGLEVHKNLYIQKAQPSPWNVDEVWLDVSVKPYICKIKKSDDLIENIEIVPNSSITILSGGGGNVENRPYNVSGYALQEDLDAFKSEVESEITELNSDITALDNNAVHKTNTETISGDKTFTRPIVSNGVFNVTQGNLTVKNLTNGGTTDAVIAINSDTNRRCGSLRFANGSGYNEVMLTAAKENGDISSMGIRNTNGTLYAYCPTYTNYADSSTKIVTTAYLTNRWITSKATTTSSASKNRPAVVVQNYVNGTSWYRVWSDGWIEQGGRQECPDYWTITFPKAFTNTNYVFLSASEGEDANCVLGVMGRTTTKINGNNADQRTLYYNWRACGY